VELARALAKLPPDIRFIGVEGKNFNAGEELSLALSKTKDALIAEILNSLKSQESIHA
jgi:hypothetical protein